MKSIEIMASPAPVFTIDLGYYMENIIWLTWSPHILFDTFFELVVILVPETPWTFQFQNFCLVLTP